MTTRRIIGLEHLPLVSRLIEVLETEKNPVNQQIAIELLIMRHALRMGDLRASQFVIDGIAKHATQLIMDPPVDLGDL